MAERKRKPSGLMALGSGTLSSYTPTLNERAVDWINRSFYGDDRAGRERAENIMNIAQFSPVGIATGMYDAGRALGIGDYTNAGLNLAMAGAPGPPIKKAGIRAFHGSPHDFDKFSLEKIGTGEGAQAYGHGLYFAEKEPIAESYRDSLSMDKNFKLSTGREIPSWIARAATGYDFISNPVTSQRNLVRIAELRTDFQQRLAQSRAEHEAGDWNAAGRMHAQQEILAALDEIEAGAEVIKPGRMYEVEINANPEDFLDWDKPLSEHSEQLRSNPIISPLVGEDAAARNRFPGGGEGELSGANLVARLAHKRTPEGWSEYDYKIATDELKKAGIPGIKYLDAGSRAAGDGSRNYVVFDDSLINIIRKYGMAGLLLAGGGAMASPDQAQAQPVDGKTSRIARALLKEKNNASSGW